MILRALADYYDRLDADPLVEVPPYGFTEQKIYFCLLLDRDGGLIQVADLRQKNGDRTSPSITIAPSLAGRTSGIKPLFLCDNTGYVLGGDGKGNEQKAQDKFEEFRRLHHELLDSCSNADLKAVLRFLDRWSPANCEKLGHWEEMAGYNVVFRLDGELRYLHQYPEVRQIWCDYLSRSMDNESGVCLVTGQTAQLARLHPMIKGVRGSQPTGAAIVSFNLDAFTSYGKDQNYNAPVSEDRAFAYVTALNRLLTFGSRQKIQLGDTATVFWTEKPSPAEILLPQLMDAESLEDERRAHDPDLLVRLRGILEALRDGKYPPDLGDPSVRFYILGLSPNATRLAVRFWSVSSVGELASRVGQHFQDLAIEREWDSDPEFPSLYRILNEPFTRRAAGKKPDVMDEYPSPLSAALVRAVFTGVSYPRALLSMTLCRIRADGQVNHLRAATIKAFITRQCRINKLPMEVGMALNPDSNDIGYLLGRLFAALEKAQQDALGRNINATIKDRYFGAASATPGAVFPQLMRLAQHHIQKAEYGRNTERRIEEIAQKIGSFPAHLSLEEQGMFTLGYYHQRPVLWHKSNKTGEE